MVYLTSWEGSAGASSAHREADILKLYSTYKSVVSQNACEVLLPCPELVPDTLREKRGHWEAQLLPLTPSDISSWFSASFSPLIRLE